MKSMTGYARVEGLIDNRRCVIEIKTVNHRYRDINLRLPKSFGPLEIPMRNAVAASIHRGRVDLTVQIENGGEENIRVGLNVPLAREYYGLLSRLRDDLCLPDDISLSHMLALKDLVVLERVEDPFEDWDSLRLLLESALTALDSMRNTEGAVLRKDLQEKVESLSRLRDEIQALASNLPALYRERLLKRFYALDAPFEIDESRLLTEAFLFAERADIAEEVVRIGSHLHQCETLFEEQTPIGRKLDFIVQEIHREFNTIGSKSDDTHISQAVIEAKSNVEKMREQVQNVE
ncbi:MAG: YicC family protein [Deltaproteobacteria bacterium]|nr:YicC family protein [Deltaproteobacteria bacterium]